MTQRFIRSFLGADQLNDTLKNELFFSSLVLRMGQDHY